MRACRLVLLVLAVPTFALAENPPKIAPFTLPDSASKPVSPLAEKDQRALVVAFIGTECPINNAYLPRLAEMHAEFKGKGVGFVAINSNQHDTAAKVGEHAKKFAVPFPVLKDERNAVADKFGAKRTPEVFLLDATSAVRYRGRIDDQFAISIKRPAPTRRDLAEAIGELLADKPISVATTEVAGCLISRVAAPAKTEAKINYTGHVAAILERRCVECHRTGQIGPMSLRNYEDAVAWSGPIQEAVSEGRMPPWHADPKIGRFANDRRLTPDERETLLSWIEQGCAKGEGEATAKREFAEGWTIGKPDVVFTMTKPCDVPAQATRWGIPYRYFIVDTEFTEDRWIQAAQTKPGARDVVHHIIVYVIKPGERRTRSEDGIGNGFLVSYAPGDMPLVCPPGSAKKIPKGAQLLFQMHYTPNGKAQTDRSSVGLIFAKEPPKQEVNTKAIATNRFAIPPGDGNHRVESAATLREDAVLLSLSPHMHLRGKDFEYRAILPDGKTQTLLSVPKYDFNWQTTYHLEKPLSLPAGTRIECTAHFDNSDKNANNPDPKKTVRWGDQTWEEMMIGFVDYVYVGGKK
jgi:peroxiredoxin